MDKEHNHIENSEKTSDMSEIGTRNPPDSAEEPISGHAQEVSDTQETQREPAHLSKAQRKKLKRQKIKGERSLEWQKKERRRKIQNYIIYGVLILAVVGFVYWKFVPPKNAAIINIEPSSYNFGAVSQAAGAVSTTMTITNTGNEDLVLKNMDSSCMCTTATITYDGIESPRFGMAMHGTNPKNWQQIIPVGESAKLNVYYDPNVHKELRGQVTRSVFIYSNDPRNKKQEVRIDLVQTN